MRVYARINTCNEGEEYELIWKTFYSHNREVIIVLSRRLTLLYIIIELSQN